MKKMIFSVMALMISLMAMATQEAFVRIRLTSPSGTSSVVRLTQDNERTAAYESGYDSQKMMYLANSESVLMYGFVGEDKCEDIKTNKLQGVKLGFVTNNVDANGYKLKFENVSGIALQLYDAVEDQIIDIINNDEYEFNATAGQVDFENRFSIYDPTPVCTTVRTGLTVDNYYTICLPKAVTAANGASFWNMSNRGEGVAYLVEAELPLVAGRPYVIQAEADELCVEYSGDPEAASAFGALHGTFAAMDQDALTAAGTDIYLLKNNELWLVSGQTGNSLAANRAYVKYSELIPENPQPAPGRRVRAIPMQPNVATGIDAIDANEAPAKMIIDGKMVIIRGEHMFDATGRMVK